MSTIIIGTLAMMAGAFAIGFAVAYLIKFISLWLYKFETFSLSNYRLAVGRARSIRKIRTERINLLFDLVQLRSKDALLDYFFPPQTANEVIDYQTDNELLRYRQGQTTDENLEWLSKKEINILTDNQLIHYRNGKN